MRRMIAGIVAFGIAVLVGCQKVDSVPETPPPDKSPPTTGEQVYRPTFNIGQGSSGAGTGFCLTAPSGKIVAVTACHVLEKPEWNSVRSVSFEAMTGGASIPLPNKPTYLGRSFDELTPIESGSFPVFDTSEDFAIWLVPESDPSKPKVLELAANEPKVNEWVWVAGAEGGRGFAMYRAKVTKVKGGTMVMKQHDKFTPRGFSGGPILTVDGKVIGNMLAADPSSGEMEGATAGTIRKRISSY